MAKEKMEEIEKIENGLDLDLTMDEIPLVEVPMETKMPVKDKEPVRGIKEKMLINCLRNERVIVRHIPKESGMVNNPKHILYGGMAENAVIIYVVPRLSSGMFVNVLTDSEKAFLEEMMGLEYNALSVYKRENNFWDDSNEEGIATVRLLKQDNYLNLADPEDYIRYKILLANKDYIAPSIQALEDAPKVTYKFVIIAEGEETRTAKDNMSATMRCYKEFGKIENDADMLRTILELLTGTPIAANTKLEFLQTKINTLIQANSKTFLQVVNDPLLPTKALIKKSIEAGHISNRGGFLYLRNDNTPLCESGEEPVINTAAKYLNAPKHQETKFFLEAKLK